MNYDGLDQLVDQMQPVLWLLPLLPFIGLAVIVFCKYGEESLSSLVQNFRKHRARKKPAGPGVITYKKAVVKQLRIVDRDQRRIHLQLAGVTGTSYRADDEATNPIYGFHAYRELDDALGHEQSGEVVLEVLLSGQVKVHDKGYEASHQRVLQVLYTPQHVEIDLDRDNTFLDNLNRTGKAISHRKTVKSLLGQTWTDQHGTQIVFAPVSEIKRGRARIKGFTPTAIPAQTEDVPALAA